MPEVSFVLSLFLSVKLVLVLTGIAGSRFGVWLARAIDSKPFKVVFAKFLGLVALNMRCESVPS